MMYIQKLPYIIYREYSNYGYLTDNRNFGYDSVSKGCKKVGDLLLSKESCVFYSVLSTKPQELNAIVENLSKIFEDASRTQLHNDAVAFYQQLSEQGFLICSDTGDCIQIPTYLSYAERQTTFLSETKDEQEIILPNFSETDNYLSRVHVDISSLCNERCIHCYIPAKCKCNTMSERLFDRILQQCIVMKVLNITLSGGEPMLNSNLVSFLKKSFEHNFSINLLSNLTLLNDDLIGVMASNPLLSVQASLYSMNETVHDSITGVKGSFRKTYNAILQLYERNIPMQINCPIMRQNLNCYHEVIDWATSMNIESSADYMLFGCYDCSRSNLHCRLDGFEIKEVVKSECSDANYLNNIRNAISEKHVKVTDSICPICKHSLCISTTGDVYPCEGWQRKIVGNITETSLEKIWGNSKDVVALRGLQFKDFQKCCSCDNKKYCSPCLIMNANERDDGNWKIPNPYLCEIAEIKRSIIEPYVSL